MSEKIVQLNEEVIKGQIKEIGPQQRWREMIMCTPSKLKRDS